MGWLQGILDDLGIEDVDVSISWGSGNVSATTSGTTGHPSIIGRVGDLQIERWVLVGVAGLVLWKVL